MGKNKGIQFNLQKRLTLSRLLSKGSSAKETGEILNMDPTSISREIKRNRVQTQEQRIEGSICFTCINKTNCAAIVVLDAEALKNVGTILNLNVKKQKGSLIFVTDVQRLRIVHLNNSYICQMKLRIKQEKDLY